MLHCLIGLSQLEQSYAKIAVGHDEVSLKLQCLAKMRHSLIMPPQPLESRPKIAEGFSMIRSKSQLPLGNSRSPTEIVPLFDKLRLNPCGTQLCSELMQRPVQSIRSPTHNFLAVVELNRACASPRMGLDRADDLLHRPGGCRQLPFAVQFQDGCECIGICSTRFMRSLHRDRFHGSSSEIETLTVTRGITPTVQLPLSADYFQDQAYQLSAIRSVSNTC